METMHLPEAKVELAADQKASRFTMQAVKLDVEQKVFVATDGHILAAVPAVVEEEDHSALIATDTIKQLRAIAKAKKYGRPIIRTNGKVTVESDNLRTEFPLVEGVFPKWENVKPKMETSYATLRQDLIDIRKEFSLTYEVAERLDKVIQQMEKLNTPIGIDAALLLRLAQALSGDATNKQARVKLWITGPSNAIGVQVSDAGAWGAIMPVRL